MTAPWSNVRADGSDRTGSLRRVLTLTRRGWLAAWLAEQREQGSPLTRPLGEQEAEGET